jgi:tRNA threonylcarbamoyladenosine biosynthesis protein TsaB
MLVLALDTTTRMGSCALARDGVVIREAASDPQQSAAEHLPGDLIVLLDSVSVGLDAIDVFAVATGPGSFTGLRVGIATMQGLAFAAGKALIGVSALDALARIATGRVLSDPGGGPDQIPTETIATWIEAWRGEVYAGLYRGDKEIEAASVEHPAAIIERVPVGTTFIGDGAVAFAGLIQTRNGTVLDTPLIAGAIAEIADARARRGERPGPEEIRPLYVRRAYAESAPDARSRE